MINLLDRANIYFDTFSNKDLDGLKEMFADDITLRDWDINVVGIDDVLEANSNIFNSVESIKVNPINIWDASTPKQKVIVAELEIVVNDKEKILVTDILEFQYSENRIDILEIDDYKIKSIRAYKG